MWVRELVKKLLLMCSPTNTGEFDGSFFGENLVVGRSVWASTRHWLSVSYLPFFFVPFSQEKNQRRLLPNMRKSHVLIIRPEQCQRSSAWSSQFSATLFTPWLQNCFSFGVFFTQIELYESHRSGPTSSDSDLDTSDDEEFAGVSALATAFNIAKGRKFLTIFLKWQKGWRRKAFWILEEMLAKSGRGVVDFNSWT